MLVLSRRESQQIKLGDSIVVTVVRVGGDRVRLGIEAPSDVLVLRGELRAARRGQAIAPASICLTGVTLGRLCAPSPCLACVWQQDAPEQRFWLRKKASPDTDVPGEARILGGRQSLRSGTRTDRAGQAAVIRAVFRDATRAAPAVPARPERRSSPANRQGRRSRRSRPFRQARNPRRAHSPESPQTRFSSQTTPSLNQTSSLRPERPHGNQAAVRIWIAKKLRGATGVGRGRNSEPD